MDRRRSSVTPAQLLEANKKWENAQGKTATSSTWVGSTPQPDNVPLHRHIQPSGLHPQAEPSTPQAVSLAALRVLYPQYRTVQDAQLGFGDKWLFWIEESEAHAPRSPDGSSVRSSASARPAGAGLSRSRWTIASVACYSGAHLPDLCNSSNEYVCNALLQRTDDESLLELGLDGTMSLDRSGCYVLVRSLHEHAVSVLEHCSCVASPTFRPGVVARAMNVSEDIVVRGLRAAVELELISTTVRRDKDGPASHARFTSSLYKEACSAQIGVDSCAAIHLQYLKLHEGGTDGALLHASRCLARLDGTEHLRAVIASAKDQASEDFARGNIAHAELLLSRASACVTDQLMECRPSLAFDVLFLHARVLSILCSWPRVLVLLPNMLKCARGNPQRIIALRLHWNALAAVDGARAGISFALQHLSSVDPKLSDVLNQPQLHIFHERNRFQELLKDKKVMLHTFHSSARRDSEVAEVDIVLVDIALLAFLQCDQVLLEICALLVLSRCISEGVVHPHFVTALAAYAYTGQFSGSERSRTLRAAYKICAGSRCSKTECYFSNCACRARFVLLNSMTTREALTQSSQTCLGDPLHCILQDLICAMQFLTGWKIHKGPIAPLSIITALLMHAERNELPGTVSMISCPLHEWVYSLVRAYVLFVHVPRMEFQGELAAVVYLNRASEGSIWHVACLYLEAAGVVLSMDDEPDERLDILPEQHERLSRIGETLDRLSLSSSPHTRQFCNGIQKLTSNDVLGAIGLLDGCAEQCKAKKLTMLSIVCHAMCARLFFSLGLMTAATAHEAESVSSLRSICGQNNEEDLVAARRALSTPAGRYSRRKVTKTFSESTFVIPIKIGQINALVAPDVSVESAIGRGLELLAEGANAELVMCMLPEFVPGKGVASRPKLSEFYVEGIFQSAPPSMRSVISSPSTPSRSRRGLSTPMWSVLQHKLLERCGNLCSIATIRQAYATNATVFEDSGAFLQTLQAEGHDIQSIICFPVHFFGSISTIVYMHSRSQVDDFTPGTLELMHLVAGQIAQCVSRDASVRCNGGDVVKRSDSEEGSVRRSSRSRSTQFEGLSLAPDLELVSSQLGSCFRDGAARTAFAAVSCYDRPIPDIPDRVRELMSASNASVMCMANTAIILKLAQDTLALHVQDVEIFPLAKQCAAMAQLLWGSTIELAADLAEHCVYADPDALERLLTTLLCATCKVVSDPIAVSAHTNGGYVVVVMGGRTMEAEKDIEKLFMPRMATCAAALLDSSKTSVDIATCIPLCHVLADFMDCVIDPPEYADKSFTLSLRVPVPGQGPSSRKCSFEGASTIDVEESEEMVGTKRVSEGAIRKPISAQPLNFDPVPRHVLLVDDSLLNIRIMTQMLRSEGFRVSVAQSGFQAISFLRRGLSVDLVVCDLIMPEFDGYEVTKALRAQYTQSELPIIVVTARQMQSAIVKAFEAGVNDFILKPVQKAEFIQRVRLHIQVSSIANTYAKFVPRQFLSRLGRPNLAHVQVGECVECDLTIMFADMRNFTSLSESMTPQESFAFINSYLGLLSPVVHRHGGFIDKYIGDGIMALFPEDPGSAIAAAMEMHRVVSRASPDVSIGIGVHAGPTVIGVVGEQNRMACTVISDAVNLASRIEGLTRHFRCHVLISEQVRTRLHDGYVTRNLGSIAVKGREKETQVYEVLMEDDLMRDQKIAYDVQFQQALLYLKAKEVQRAASLLLELRERNQDDAAVEYYLAKAKSMVDDGVWRVRQIG